MASVNQIHVNNSTRISLNDRFTVMQSVAPVHEPKPIMRRSRSRSRSVGPQVMPQMNQRVQAIIPPPPNPTARLFNPRVMLPDKRNKMLMALRLKRKSLRTNVSARQHALWATNEAVVAAAANLLAPPNRGRINRSLLATMRSRQLTGNLRGNRSNSRSAANVIARLGIRRGRELQRNIDAVAQSRSRSRSRQSRPLNRVDLNMSTHANMGARARSRSRSNLSRANSRQNLRRANSQSNLQRSNSRVNLAHQLQRGPRKINRNFQQRQGVSISSRLGVRAGGQTVAIGRGTKGLRKQQPIMRNKNVGGGNQKRQRQQQQQQQHGGGMNKLRRINQGRITKNVRTNRQQIGNRVQQQRQGSGNNKQGRQQNNRPFKKNAPNTGNGRNRGGRRNGGVGGRKKIGAPNKTREDLDKELDQYMADTKPQFH